MGTPQSDRPQPPLSTPAYVPAPSLSTTTRQLCCAPYVDVGFANDVIREVVEQERRAVPPSYGFDLDPIVRHCLRARRLLLGRAGVVTLLLLIGLCVAAQWTLPWLALCGLITCGQSARFRSQSIDTKIRVYGILGLVTIVLCCFGIFWTAGIAAFFKQWAAQVGNASGYSTGSPYDGYGTDAAGPTSVADALRAFAITTSGGLYQALPLVLGIATFTALFLFRRRGYAILATELAPGVHSAPPPVHNARVTRRLAIVAATQRGNITVQERNPFLGSGRVAHGWSFAVTLRPAKDPSGGRAAGPDRRIPIDGVELHRRVREAVLGLRDTDLPEGERIPGLFVTPHVVADGVRAVDDPLINPHTDVPHTLASDAAIRAIIGCPQGGLRHYERIVVPAAGKAVHTHAGDLVVQAQDLGIGVTAYAHFAVEGGMLYTEFMATVLPPVRAPYTLVDALRPERVTGRTFRDTVRRLAIDTVASPWWLLQGVWRSATLERRMRTAAEASEEYRSYDYGAELSVRELAAEPDVDKFLQRLDGWKYVKLLDKVIGETVIDFLTEHGIDTGEFRTAITHIRNEYGNVNNISGGIQNFGGTNVNTQYNSTDSGGSKG
jgi:hypothetical protein